MNNVSDLTTISQALGVLLVIIGLACIASSLSRPASFYGKWGKNGKWDGGDTNSNASSIITKNNNLFLKIGAAILAIGIIFLLVS